MIGRGRNGHGHEHERECDSKQQAASSKMLEDDRELESFRMSRRGKDKALGSQWNELQHSSTGSHQATRQPRHMLETFKFPSSVKLQRGDGKDLRSCRCIVMVGR